MKRMRSRVPTWRWVVLSLAVVMVAAMTAMTAGIAEASGSGPRVAGPVRLTPRSEIALSAAPAGLQAAMARTLGARAAGGRWSQRAELAASDGAEGDFFGATVAISGTTAVVGAPDKNSRTGAAYVFARSGKAWSEQAKLTASDAAKADAFGVAVAISGNTVVVGASGKKSDTGAAYVFARAGRTWSQRAELTDPGRAKGDAFGNAVAVSRNTALVGAPGTNEFTGAAYVFVRTGKAWSQRAKLTASDGAKENFFGNFRGVAIDGNTALIAAPGISGGRTGAVYVFVRTGKAWSQRAKLTPPRHILATGFGGSVAISGKTAVVGAPNELLNRGAVYVFARSGKAWALQAELVAPDRAASDLFGYDVGISGKTVVAGAPFKNSHTGKVYVFVRSGRTWSQQAELTASAGASGDNFGLAVGISGKTAVAGADGRNDFTGAAYVFVR